MYMPTDYSDERFWTEDRCHRQRDALLNIVNNPAKFPKANLDNVWRQIEELEIHMLTAFLTPRTFRAVTSPPA